MTVKDMRDAVANVYSGPAWRLRVQEMSERQVIAIFKDMIEQGRLNKNGKRLLRPSAAKKSDNPVLKEQENSVQMTIWDIMDRKDCT
jgi:hypothetical protein